MRKALLFLLACPLLAATLSIDAGSATDQFFIGGAAFTTSTCPEDNSVRFGAFSYHIPMPAGAYMVTLKLCETGTVSAKGQRIFSVKQAGLDRFDLFAAAGLAPKEVSYITASNGFIDIDFTYTTKSAIVSSIDIDVIAVRGGTPGTGFPLGAGMTRQIPEPAEIGTACQDGDYALGASPVSPIMGATLYLCIAGALRRFHGDPEPWGNAAVSDLGGVLQMETQDPDKITFPPVFFFRTGTGEMIGPFKFAGPGPIPSGLAFPVLIQSFPRAAAQ